MKLQIDTKEKTIKVDQTVNFGELIKVLDKLLPKEWKDYSLEAGSVIYWPSYPTIIYQHHEPVIPYWRKLPEITYGSDTVNVEIN